MATALRSPLHAVVIGSGMAGLPCSQMLSRHFDKVLLLERDKLQSSYEGCAIDMCKVWC
jgi:2-polyprenyl-6-methoxyphenol hydroxylase-like FAD-dependent oxidoreductase